MSERRVRLDELDASSREVHGSEEGRREGKGQDRGADVVTEAGQRQLLRPGATADGRRCLVDLADRPARARVIAAARPFGPAPTTTASSLGVVTGRRSG